MQRIRRSAIARTLITAIAKLADHAAVALGATLGHCNGTSVVNMQLKRLDKWRKKNPNLP